MSLSPLAVLNIERETWKMVISLSRTFKNRKVHAFSKKMVRQIGEQMLEIAKDEMTSEGAEEENEEIDSETENENKGKE